MLAALAAGWLICGLVLVVQRVAMASRKDSVYRTALRTREGKIAGLLPPVVAVAGCAAALTVLRPTVGESFPDDFSQFFGTSAQVIATLLVALALEKAAFQSATSPSATIAGRWGLVFVALGAVAAVTALSTRLPADVYAAAFAVTVGAGIAALLSVVLAGWRTIATGAREAEIEKFRQLAAEGDPGAVRALARLGVGQPSSISISRP